MGRRADIAAPPHPGGHHDRVDWLTCGERLGSARTYRPSVASHDVIDAGTYPAFCSAQAHGAIPLNARRLRPDGFRLGLVEASIVAIAERLDVTTTVTLDHRYFRVVRPAHYDVFDLVSARAP